MLLNKIIKITDSSNDLGIDQITCKVIEEVGSGIKISYVNVQKQELSEKIIDTLEEHKDVIGKQMKCSDYIDVLCNGSFFDELVLEMKKGEGYSSNSLIKAVLYSSHADGVYISDLNDCDIDKELESVYKNWQL